ncbi:hypothetical protein Tsac_2843 [Thermoanaerobacterium phage THSA-485A]|uniref:hypothetical protein n=1 Tax=Thermoanaerobacterium phage THSA-485A TaxID=1126885 RepID=UPI000263F834|nr:hypothetical protein Tsac_2843 [Thermoanaerobacterium phage THSA-485A]AFK87696.1 hypothetical protein Tsac_2843 [Thermoanaerobacterium phage THSA-485A]
MKIKQVKDKNDNNVIVVERELTKEEKQKDLEAKIADLENRVAALEKLITAKK